jgi:hypothetical protein
MNPRDEECLDDPERLKRLAALDAKVTGEQRAIMTERTKWGPGPWQNEPDRDEWKTAAGLPGLALRGSFGNWCGYVAVPPGHLAHGQPYDSFRVSVHGGLTYANACQGEICHVPAPGEPDNVYWFGFDCGHYQDVKPGMDALLRTRGIERPAMIYTYRTLEYVRAEVEDLAAQLVALTAEDIEATGGAR